jgi:putative ABC transport system permease protein
VRTALTVLTVALGVGVVIAIDLASQAAAESFHTSLQSLTGKNDLVITATGGLDENVLGRLIKLPYAFRFQPRIEDFAFLKGRGEAIPFIGVDLIGSQGVGGAADSSSALFVEPNPIWVTESVGLHEGERIRLLIGDRLTLFTVAGTLPKERTTTAQRLIVADIGLAQRVTSRVGRLDSIDVDVPAGQSLEHWRDLLKAQVPPSVSVQPQGARTEENEKMLAAFRWNLHVLSYIALIVGGFLIYNTISISVVRRRTEIGIVRALGGTRSLILRGFLSEAMFFAVTGSLLGIVIGRVMATGAVGLIGSTVRALYVTSEPAPIQLTPEGVGTGVVLGFVVSFAAALAPALEASRVGPVEAMARGRTDYLLTKRSGVLGWWGFILAAAAAASALAPPIDRRPIFGYLAAMLLIGATATMVPAAVRFLGDAVNAALKRLYPLEVVLAMRSLSASLGRTSVLTAALATAIAMTASVGIMVGSFRQTVWVWMNHQLQADFYLRPAGAAGADRHPTMNPKIADLIEVIPGVAAVDRFRAYSISYEGLPTTLAGGQSSTVKNSATTLFLPGENKDTILQKLPSGNFVVVSEPFANKHNVHAGSVLRLPLAGGLRSFTVLGTYYDYSTESGYILMDRRSLLKYLPDPAESNLAVYLKPSADESAVRAAIDRAIAGRAILVFSNKSLRNAAIETFDRTFQITYSLEAIAVIVAVMGIAGAMLAMVIDRRRDFALLRFIGAERKQVRGIIVAEAGLLGLLATGIGTLLGTALSLILIFVINKQSFGWSIQFHWPVAILLFALAGIYAATVLAGFYPAHVALRMEPIEAIHEE